MRNTGRNVLLVDEAQKRTLAAKIKAEMSSRNMTRDELQAALEQRGVRISLKTISNITTGNHLGREANLTAIADVLDLDQADAAPSSTHGARLTTDELLHDAESAQAAYERAVADLVAAEARTDAASMAAFKRLAEIEHASAEVRRREEAYGRTLTPEELQAVRYSPPSPAEVAQMMATHAEIDPHEWTRYEIALLERFNYSSPGADLTEHTAHLNMTTARLRAKRVAGIVPSTTLMDEVRAVAHSDADPGLVDALVDSAKSLWSVFEDGRGPDYGLPRSFFVIDVVPTITHPANSDLVTEEDLSYWTQDWEVLFRRDDSTAVLLNMLARRDDLLYRPGVTVPPPANVERLHVPDDESAS